MAKDFESVLRLLGDYHSFCSQEHEGKGKLEEDELSPEELEFVVAAAAVPLQEWDEKL